MRNAPRIGRQFLVVNGEMRHSETQLETLPRSAPIAGSGPLHCDRVSDVPTYPVARHSIAPAAMLVRPDLQVPGEMRRTGLNDRLGSLAECFGRVSFKPVEPDAVLRGSHEAKLETSRLIHAPRYRRRDDRAEMGLLEEPGSRLTLP